MWRIHVFGPESDVREKHFIFEETSLRMLRTRRKNVARTDAIAMLFRLVPGAELAVPPVEGDVAVGETFDRHQGAVVVRLIQFVMLRDIVRTRSWYAFGSSPPIPIPA